MLGVLLIRGPSQAAPDQGRCAPSHPARRESLWQMHAVTSGLRFSALHARTWSRTSHVQACPPLHPGAASPSPPPVHPAPACTARGRPSPSPPCPAPPRPQVPLPAPPPPPPRWQALARTQGALEAGPGGRFKRLRGPAGCQRWRLQPKEPQRPQRRRTRSRTDRRTDAPPAQLALPPRSSLCIQVSGGAGLGAVGRGVLPAGLGAMLRPRSEPSLGD